MDLDEIIEATKPGSALQSLLRVRKARNDLLSALKDASDALESFDGISIKGTKLHWSRANRHALRKAQRVIKRYDDA